MLEVPHQGRCPSVLVLAAVLASTLTLGSCADQTALLVEVTSALTVPDDIDELGFEIVGEDSAQMAAVRRAIDSPWPHSLSVRHGARDDEGVRITVTGYLSGVSVASRTEMSAFVPGESRVVRVVLGDADMDGGLDGGLDGGDGGRGDAGCGAAVECDDGVACTLDSCVDGTCVNAPDDRLCADGTTCDPGTGCPPRTCAADDDCDDGLVCNGTETCVTEACVVGTPYDCDDADACTSDACSEAGRGTCLHTTRDADGDGFGDATCAETGGVPATDCNDGNPAIFPGAPEECNGADDDCSGTCDDLFTCCSGESGTCMTSCGTTGMRVCSATCSWGVCSPPAEECNGVDDDCNGAADDIFACVQGASEPCTTTCGTMGSRVCDSACAWGSCTPPMETCNGRDDDCDMMVDEGFSCVRGSTAPCMTTCGTTGTRTCNASCNLGACQPPPEACNGIDDNCNGMIDETVECTAGAMRSCMTTCGTTGSQTCSAMCVWPACTPPAEACNGADDDCDGLIDEGFTCVPGAMGSCTTSCGTTGTRTCTAACAWGACTPPAEACNGRDDDCDTMCDETFACCAGSSGSCMTSCGTTGSRTCTASCGWSACSPPAETCNGVDDDCNMVCDDGFACCSGATGTCTTACGSTGSRTCNASCAWGACTPPAEICNAVDDDCDSMIDEGFACVRGSTQGCTTTCGSTGTQTCGAMCTWGMCVPPAEACNGVDDDCDTMIDEGCGSCSSCALATTVSGGGGRYRVNLGANAQTGSCGGAGAEAYLTLTISAASDVFISTHGAGVDTVLYVRSCSCTGTEVACSDDSDGRTTSTLQLTNLPPDTYNIFVDTKTAMSGSFDVDVYVSPTGTASNRCGRPTLIPAGATSVSGNTCAFTNDNDLVPVAGNSNCPYSFSGDAVDRVYYFYLPAPATLDFDGCNTGTDYDTAIYWRDVCSDTSSANQVACNDDSCSGPRTCTASLRSSKTVSLGAGLHYFFVDGYYEATWPCPCGNYQFTITGL